MRKYLSIAGGVLVALSVLSVATVNLKTTPPLWWDEGWTLSVARNWVEMGHYGRLLNGQPAPAGLQAAFPVTAMVALSFHLFGIGIYQARLIAVIFTMATLAILYYLACSIYNRSIALGALAVLIFMSGHSDINTLVLGRQVLAEIPAMFYLLAGYAFFSIGWQ